VSFTPGTDTFTANTCVVDAVNATVNATVVNTVDTVYTVDTIGTIVARRSGASASYTG
jgi:hypothetical protein